MKKYRVTYKISYVVEAETAHEALKKGDENFEKALENGFIYIDESDVKELKKKD